MFLTLDETIHRINEGKLLHIAADESLLCQLPKGNWIGGTTPYFITNGGGILTKEKLFVNEFTDIVEYRICEYDADSITGLVKDGYSDGCTFLIIPFASDAAATYSKQAPHIEELIMYPVVGWISGYDLSTAGTAKVMNGSTKSCYSDKAVALHISLPKEHPASVGIVNIFEDSEEDAILEFPDDALEISNCVVNGKTVKLAEYIAEQQIDIRMPLVANYNGIYINVSVKEIHKDTGTVSLYAPVFRGEKYRFAKKVSDYGTEFKKRINTLEEVRPKFSCNCILNYLYGSLEGKATPPFEGPVTFGEVAYQLLNQTLVYVEY